MFGGAAALVVATPAIATPQHPDADLIALCDQFKELERDMQAAFKDDMTNAEWEAADKIADATRESQAPLLDRMCAMRFTTMEGAAAVASCWALWFDPQMAVTAEDDGGNTDDRLMALLMRGLALAGRA
jgi:hypothetical protein